MRELVDLFDNKVIEQVYSFKYVHKLLKYANYGHLKNSRLDF